MEHKAFSFSVEKAGDKSPLEFKFQDPVNPDRVRRFVASDDTIDRYAEVVMPSGASFSNYANNPVVLTFHDYSLLPVGKAVAGGVEGGKVMLDLEFDPPEIDADADKVLRKIDHGTLNTGSIGFIPKGFVTKSDEKAADLFARYPGADKIYTEWELLEYSIVPVPANPNALAAHYKALHDAAHIEEFGNESNQAASDSLPLSAATKKLETIIERLDKE